GESTVSRLLLKLTQTLDRSTDSFVVSEHAAQPAMVDIGHTGTSRFFTNRFAGCTLGANEQDFVLVRSQILNHTQRIVHGWHSVLKVDDMDFVTCAEDELAHLWVPVTGLVTEVSTCF